MKVCVCVCMCACVHVCNARDGTWRIANCEQGNSNVGFHEADHTYNKYMYNMCVLIKVVTNNRKRYSPSHGDTLLHILFNNAIFRHLTPPN